jgi:hypothetical protein
LTFNISTKEKRTMADIKIIIDKRSFPPTITTEVDGMKGEGCTKLLDELQEVMRMETMRQTLKPEYKTVGQRLPLRR